MNLYDKFLKLKSDTKWIGLEKGDTTSDYDCTPLGAKIIGWESGGIHYCFLEGFGEKVFAVNPDSCYEKDNIPIYTYPIAENFEDFLKLILSGRGVTAIEQIVWMSKDRFEAFVISDDNNNFIDETNKVLNEISQKLEIKPMKNPYEYVKDLQNKFDYRLLKFSDRFYENTGIDNPREA